MDSLPFSFQTILLGMFNHLIERTFLHTAPFHDFRCRNFARQPNTQNPVPVIGQCYSSA